MKLASLPHIANNRITEILRDDDTLEKNQVINSFYKECRPRILDPILQASSPESCNYLNIETESICEFLSDLSKESSHITPFAWNYSGHQFGFYTSQLGAGRCMTCCEFSHNNARFELQIKGAGPTPFSRNGDGLCTLADSFMEFELSERLHSLNIPTSRALAVVSCAKSGHCDSVLDRTGILIRYATSFIRFGNFELFYYRNLEDKLRILADFVIDAYFPEIQQSIVNIEIARVSVRLNKYGCLLQQIIHKTAIMVASWQANGFVHGLLNTDQMSILGITLPNSKSVNLF
jgi:uncharacterized protein YdiU (UPF0061 family)